MSSVLRILIVMPAILLLASCGTDKKELNRRMSLSRHDDIPYGTKVAYELLPHLFPDATITVSTNDNPGSLANLSGNGRVFMVIGHSVVASASDVTALMNFVQQGNQVFISANRISENLLKSLSVQTTGKTPFYAEPDSLTVGVYSPVDTAYKEFAYPGDSYDNWITRLDTQYTSVLGRDGRGRPNFIRLTYKGGGAVYLQFAPLAFSNFFLLHKHNIVYYEKALSYLPADTREIIWDEYYRYDHSRSFSALDYILNNPRAGMLRWAFWLLLLLFLILYLIESKRRQREIPVINPLSNTSLDFVRTIGRLYFQRRDNHNLAMKMVAYFQDQVRTRFHLPVTALDEAFVDRLAYRTGYPKESLAPLVDYMYHLPTKAYISDEELLDFHGQLEAFYKHT